MKISNIIITAAIGIGLLSGAIFTKPFGLSDEDRACYETAVSLQYAADTIGFTDFYLTDYPVSVCDGKNDYVLISNGNSYDVVKRAPVIETLAGTIYEVDGQYEVIVPARSLMKSLVGVIGETWNENEQAAMIWHEAFHCWQMSNYEDNIVSILGENSFEDDSFGGALINSQYTENPKAAELFRKQLVLLSDCIGEKDVDIIKESIVKYKKLDEERLSLLSEDTVCLEKYYTRVEGTASYVEACICKSQDANRYESEYQSRLAEYSEGSEKYYTLGRSQCMLLDKLDSNWKTEYDFSDDLIDLIYEKLGV